MIDVGSDEKELSSWFHWREPDVAIMRRWGEYPQIIYIPHILKSCLKRFGKVVYQFWRPCTLVEGEREHRMVAN